MYTGLLSVIATLCVSYGLVLTLGCSIGDTVFAMADVLYGAMLAGPDGALRSQSKDRKTEDASPYGKWCRPLLHYLCRSACVSFLFYFQRIASTFHASLKGSKKLVLGGLKVYSIVQHRRRGTKTGGVAVANEVPGEWGDLPSYAPLLIIVLGCYGFYYQVWQATSILSWALLPLRAALAPLKVVEWALLKMVVANAMETRYE